MVVWYIYGYWFGWRQSCRELCSTLLVRAGFELKGYVRGPRGGLRPRITA